MYYVNCKRDFKCLFMCFCTNLIQQLFSWLAIISPFHDNKHITTIAFRVTTSLFFSSSCSRRVTDIRNIQVPEREFSRSSHSVSPVRPKTAPTRRAVRPRSPSHPNYKARWLQMNYYAWKMRAPKSQFFLPQMNNRHPLQLKKSKSWGPFLSFQLNSTANPAHLPQKWAKWAWLAVLFSW